MRPPAATRPAPRSPSASPRDPQPPRPLPGVPGPPRSDPSQEPGAFPAASPEPSGLSPQPVGPRGAPLTPGPLSRGHAGLGEVGLGGWSGGREHARGPGKAGSAAWAGGTGRGPGCRRMWRGSPWWGWGVRGAREGEDEVEARDPGVRRTRGGPGGSANSTDGARPSGQAGKERSSRTRVPGVSRTGDRPLEESSGPVGKGPTHWGGSCEAGTSPVGGERELRTVPKRSCGPGI